MPATELRRALRGHGHAMSAIVQIGKSGVTEAVLKQVQQALADHELIKVKIGGECPVDRYEVADRLGGESGINVVQMVGRVLLLYKRHPRTPRYEGKRAQAAKPSAVRARTRPKKRGRVEPPRRKRLVRSEADGTD
jgi:RNA-binding protein